VFLFAVWADNFTVVASGIDELHTMLSELASVLYAYGIRLKEKKSHWMANRWAWEKVGRTAWDMKAAICTQRSEVHEYGQTPDELLNQILEVRTRNLSPRPCADGQAESGDAVVGAEEWVPDWSAGGAVSVPDDVGCQPLSAQQGSEETVRFAQAGELVILGSRLAIDADAMVAVQFALSRGRCQWAKRRRQLCRRRVALGKRLERYYETVGQTVLHGLEGVPLSQSVLKAVQSFDRRCLRAMLCMHKREQEGWTAFRTRQHTLLRRVFTGIGRVELLAKLLQRHHGWAGHVTRLNDQHIASQWSKEGTTEQWGLTQAIFSEDMRNVTGWRHPGAGRIVRWEDVLARVHGDRWRETAMDRARWRSLRASFVASACDARPRPPCLWCRRWQGCCRAGTAEDTKE